MSEANRRKKNPELVREALLTSARRLALEQGISAVGVQAVADAAGVTKGGLFHHFESRQVLVNALIADLMGGIDGAIEGFMAADPEPVGRFTRAYVQMTFSDPGHQEDLSSLWMSMIADPHLRADWSVWLAARLERHRDTDAGLPLELVRFTADGYWLGQIVGIPSQNREALRDQLVGMTRIPPQDLFATADET